MTASFTAAPLPLLGEDVCEADLLHARRFMMSITVITAPYRSLSSARRYTILFPTDCRRFRILSSSSGSAYGLSPM